MRFILYIIVLATLLSTAGCILVPVDDDGHGEHWHHHEHEHWEH